MMMVSVIIPVYNGSKYLQKAIDSALAQSYSPLEIIVIDDGSTDATAELIAGYSGRIRMYWQENAGVASARNYGMHVAKGQFYAFLDQDDWWQSDKVAKQMAEFCANPQLGLVHTASRFYREDVQEFVPWKYMNNGSLLVDMCYGQLLMGNSVFNSSVILKREVVERVGGFQVAISGNSVQDYELWLRVAKIYSFAYLPEQLTVIRLHSEQGTLNRQKMLGDEIKLLEQILHRSNLIHRIKLRYRISALLDELGVVHLDAGSLASARSCFFQAFRLHGSWRVAMLSLACYFPIQFVEWLRTLSKHSSRIHFKISHTTS